MFIAKNYSNAESFKQWILENKLNYDTKKANTFKVYTDLQDMSEIEKDDKYAFALVKLVMDANSNVKCKKVELVIMSGKYSPVLMRDKDLYFSQDNASYLTRVYESIKAACVTDRKNQCCYLVYLSDSMAEYKANETAAINEQIAAADKTLEEFEQMEKEREDFEQRFESKKNDYNYAKLDRRDAVSRQRFIDTYLV